MQRKDFRDPARVNYDLPFLMRPKTLRTATVIATLSLGCFLTSCGISTWGDDGSRHQTKNGVSGSGYPAGQPKDAESPALASSTEQDHSQPGPKVPKDGPVQAAPRR